jgi:alpha-N-acetylglucosamine transferase
MKSLLAVMGLKNVKELDKEKLIFLDIDSIIHDDMDELFERRIFKNKKKG